MAYSQKKTPEMSDILKSGILRFTVALLYSVTEFSVSSIRKRVQADCKTDSECTRNSKNVLFK